MAARASSCNSIQLQFVSKLVRLSPQPPTTRPTSVEQRLITGHHFLFIAATWATTNYLSSSQCPAAFFHGMESNLIKNREAFAGIRFTCGAVGSPALPLSPRAFACLHGISQPAPRPNMQRHRRPCPIPMAS